MTFRRIGIIIAVLAIGIGIGLDAQARPKRRAPRKSKAQPQSERAAPAAGAKKEELARLRAEIAHYEEELANAKKTERNTSKSLDASEHQMRAIREMIGSLRSEEGRLTSEMASTETDITRSSKTLDDLKREYSRTAVAMYKRGSEHDLELILTSTSINQALVRAEYYRRLSAARRHMAARIEETLGELERSRRALAQERLEKSSVLSEKAREEARLDSRVHERRDALAEIRTNKAELQQELHRAQRAAKQIESLISRLVTRQAEREAAHPAEKAPSRTEGTKPPTATPPHKHTSSGGAFASRRGSLRWPVAGSRIAQRFGERTNPALGTVTINNGIDIAASSGAAVYAVAAGTVSMIHWIPSFGNLVIVDHANGWRSVYANLAAVGVHEGEHVGEGQRIASTDESLGGGTLHFEIWHDREKQNPEPWLGR